MSVEKIAFKGNEPQVRTKKSDSMSFTANFHACDEEKNNAAKYMIGATALASIVALGVAGYKGKLGKGIQKFLGGAEKTAEKELAETTNIGSQVVTGSEKADLGTNVNKLPEKHAASENLSKIKVSEVKTHKVEVPKTDIDLASEVLTSDATQPLQSSASKIAADENLEALNKLLPEPKIYSGKEAVQKIIDVCKKAGSVQGMQVYIPKNDRNVVVVRSIDGATQHAVYNLKDFQCEPRQVSPRSFYFHIPSTPISSRALKDSWVKSAVISKKDGTRIEISRRPIDRGNPIRTESYLTIKSIIPTKGGFTKYYERHGNDIKLIKETENKFKC